MKLLKKLHDISVFVVLLLSCTILLQTKTYAAIGDSCTIMAPGYDTCAASGEVCVAPYGSEEGYCDDSCGNNQCEQNEGENYANCPNDCNCGNGVCDYGEWGSCTQDCFCNDDNTCDTQQGENQARCGIDECGCNNNTICENDRGETIYNCADCASVGDGYCSPGESPNSPDCVQSLCGNGQIDAGEVCDTSGNLGCGYNQGCFGCQTCEPIPVCGNGIIETQLYEQCDTASALPNQGCNAGNTCVSLNSWPSGTPFCQCQPNTPVPPGDSSTCEISLTDCGMDCYSNNKPFDVFFVMDRSYSMVLGAKLNIMKTSFNSIIDALPVGSRASLITFNHAATIRNTLTTNLSSVRSWNPVNQFGPDYPVENSLTNYVDAFAKLTQEVNTHKSSFSGRNQLVYFFSDGEPTIGGPFVTQGPTQNGGNCTFGVINGQIVRTCSIGCDVPNDSCQYESATAAADAFHTAFSGLQTIAIGLDISQQHHYILANHVATPGLFSAINSSVGISQIPKTPCYPFMQGYPNCTQPGPWTTDAFCASITQPINPLNKFVDQFCEMTCEPALCKVYTGNFAQQPAYNTPTGCIGGTYSDLPDAPNQWNWQCTGTDGSSHTCAAGKESVGPMCNQLDVKNVTGSTYEFTCHGTGINYSIAITDQQGQLITTIQGPTATYTFQTGGTFTATCYIDGITGLICPDNGNNPNNPSSSGSATNPGSAINSGTPAHGSNSSNNDTQTIVGNNTFNNVLVTNNTTIVNLGGTVHQPIVNKNAYNNALLQKTVQQIITSINANQVSEVTEVRPNNVIVIAPPPPIIGTAVPCFNPCQKTITVVIPEPEIFDLALRKTVPDSVAGHAPGGIVTFDIELINQGNVPAQGIIVSDYVPVGLTLLDTTWSYDVNTRIAKKSYDSVLNPGESALLTITFTIDANASGTLINRAEIMTDNGDDIDSTPDNNQVNDCFGGDNIVTGDGSGTPNTPKCIPETDEDDHDPAEINIQVPTNPVYDLRIRKDVTPGPYIAGQTIQYTVTVYNTGNTIASGLVTDILPVGLSYTGGSTYSYAPTQGGVTVSPITGGQRQVSNITPGQYVTIQYSVIIGENTTGTLKNNVKIIPDPLLPPELVPDNPGECIDDKNPLISDSANNINNAVSGTNNRDCEEIIVQPAPSYDLRIKKDVSAGPYASGQTITYTITVLNTGTVAASGKVIDTLPVGLMYTGVSMFSSPKITNAGTGMWMITNLLPNEQVTISYKVVIGALSGPKKNIVSVFPEGNPTPEIIPYLTGGCEIGHNPLINDYAVPNTNNTDCEEIVISEPMSCVATAQPDVTKVKSKNHTMTVQCDIKNMTGTVSVDCGNGTTGTMLTKTSAECKYTDYGSYVATCMVDTVKVPGCNRPITLEKGGGGDPSSICISMVPSRPGNTYYTRKHDADIKCDVSNYSSSDIAIDCGNGIKKPGLEGTCEYRNYGSYTIHCLAKGKPIDKCSTSLTLEGSNGGGPNCGDGKKDKGEQCDDGTKNGTPASLCSKTCNLKVVDPDPGDTPVCAFVDPPSIQMGEYVPFWWDLEDELETIQGNNCTEKTVGKVRLDTMQCDFTVQAPGGKTYSYKRNCNEDNLKSVKWYYDLQKDLNTKIMPRWGQSVLNSSEWKESGYGEYAISLDKITYDVCDAITSATTSGKVTYKMITKTYEGRVCQFNFAVTAPYMMQKGSVLSSLEDDRDVLQSFHQLDGKSILDRRGEKINFLTKTSNPNTFEQVKKFAYDALDQVVSVVDATHPLALIAPVVKKSPSEEIYLVEGNVKIAHTSSIGLNRGKATTIIVKGPYTVTIHGGLPANLLLIVPEGKVIFNNLDCDNNDVVEGILLAKDFQTTATRKILTNTDLHENEWCQGGQLIVKGLIISDNIDAFATLRSQRRSTLARWFDGTKTKEEHIYGGASLRIDANTHQWDKLPPLAKQTSMVFKLQGAEFALSMPVYLDGSLLPFYLQMMIAAGEVSEVN